ncbi:MAG: pyridoxal-phosphate dependent enzyme [Firmicutes bacterium]|jgi:cysteine synthase|nr:pyridoxal-phosphate dependent enzyme [Bacillota bacterium]
MSNRLVWGPTFEEMLHPERIDPATRQRALQAQELDPLDEINLYNITWKRADGRPSHVVIPRELTGVDANIVALYARDFPTRSHKVGAAYSVVLEKQLAGEIEPGRHTLVFPSTGNYGIGGAWVGPRMGYDSLVVLPEMMSKERFQLIERYGARYIKTPGCESSVRQIYEKCRELRLRPEIRILNQFEEMGNYRFHYYVTGNTVVELLADLHGKGIGDGRCAAFVSAMGSAGTIAAGDRLKEVFPESLTVGLEPVQCPTLYNNGYGDHDIQGIGDKHVTWIHNVLDMDCLMCIDDMECKLGLQLLTDPVGMEYLESRAGVAPDTVREMSTIFGISGVCNLIGAIKTAKYYRMTEDQVVVTVLTDAIDRYHSVMLALDRRFGRLNAASAVARHHGIFLNAKMDYVQEGTVHNRDRWFNLKYYTWVEQQGKTVEQLDAQRSRSWWAQERAKVCAIDDRLSKLRDGPQPQRR